MLAKIESRIIPENIGPKLYIQHLKAYEFLSRQARGKYILDVGCGDGYGTAFLAKLARFIIGVDYDSEIILSAQRKYNADNLKYICMDAAKLGFNNDKFDIVCSFQVIEHLPEDRLLSYLGELKRVLREGGELYLSTLNLDKVMKDPYTYEKSPAHRKEFRLEELRDILSIVFDDFDIYGLHPALRHLFYLILKKSGIFKPLPDPLNPVARFSKNIGLEDFRVKDSDLKNASDFICVCKK